MKKRIIAALALLLILPLVLTSCEEGGGGSAIAPRPEPVPAPGIPDRVDVESPPGAEVPAIPEERVIIRNGDIALVVEDVLEARDEITQLATSLGGWVVNSNIFGEAEELRGFMSIRIPSDKFDQALVELRGLAVRVTSESTHTQDVTEEYVDLQSRLSNAEATESQYLTLLDQAVTVEDILRIYEALSRIRFEIEQITGRIQYLESTAAMSLISINLEPSLGPLVAPGYSASEAVNNAIRGLTAFGQGLGTAFIWIGIFSPIWGTALGIALWRRRRRRQKLNAS